MSYAPVQKSFWDNASICQQTPGTDSHGDSFFESLGLINDTSSLQYVHRLDGDMSGFSYSDWVSGSDYSPGPRSDKQVSDSPRSKTGPKRPSAEAIARRRKQNRISQANWRARNKELVEELRQEIAEQVEYNRTMHDALHSLLKSTEYLKSAIENALALPAPKGETHGNGERQPLSPESPIDTTGFDLDAPHDP